MKFNYKELTILGIIFCIVLYWGIAVDLKPYNYTVNKEKIINDYRVNLHNQLQKAISHKAKANSDTKSYQYYKGTAQGLTIALLTLDVVEEDLGQYMTHLYESIDKIVNSETDYDCGVSEALAYSLTTFDNYRNSKKYRVKL